MYWSSCHRQGCHKCFYSMSSPGLLTLITNSGPVLQVTGSNYKLHIRILPKINRQANRLCQFWIYSHINESLSRSPCPTWCWRNSSCRNEYLCHQTFMLSKNVSFFSCSLWNTKRDVYLISWLSSMHTSLLKLHLFYNLIIWPQMSLTCETLLGRLFWGLRCCLWLFVLFNCMNTMNNVNNRSWERESQMHGTAQTMRFLPHSPWQTQKDSHIVLNQITIFRGLACWTEMLMKQRPNSMCISHNAPGHNRASFSLTIHWHWKRMKNYE